MFIEKYSAAPGNATFIYVEFTLGKEHQVDLINVCCTGVNPAFIVWIYKGSINAYAAGNNQYAVFSDRVVPLSGAAYPTCKDYYTENTHFRLGPGKWTFGLYTMMAGILNLKMTLGLHPLE